MTSAVVRARDLWLEYASAGGRGSVWALRGIDLDVEPGSFVGIMGPSGSGKSSLLHVLAGLLPPTRGSVEFRDSPWRYPVARSSETRRTAVGIVFQDPFLVSHWTLAENLRVQQLVASGEAIGAIADRLGIRSLLGEFPDRVSAGERQRAAVARALVNGPGLILADEPTSCLDSENGRNVMRVLSGKRGEAALVVCSHDPRMLEGADRHYRIEDGVLRDG